MKKIHIAIAMLFVISLISCSKQNNDPTAQTIICPGSFCERVQYGQGANQWFNLYQSASASSTPVYVWAHPNGASLASPGSAYNFSDAIRNSLTQAGISFISWESTPQVQTEADLLQTETDFVTLINWLKVNGAKYKLDVTKIVSGGRSRGTWASWPGSQNLNLGIKGFFGVQAFPKDGWLVRTPQNLVTPSSLLVFLTYDESPGTTDGHKPEYGMIVRDAYIAAGIGGKTSLYHSLQENQLYDSLVPFIKRVIQ